MEDTATAPLTQLAKIVKTLRDDDVQAILSGDTRIVLVPKGSKLVTPLVLAEVAEEVRRLSDQAQVISFVDADARLTGPILKKLPDELSIPLPASVKARPAIQLYIA